MVMNRGSSPVTSLANRLCRVFIMNHKQLLTFCTCICFRSGAKSCDIQCAYSFSIVSFSWIIALIVA
jgi:hypothetical protein